MTGLYGASVDYSEYAVLLEKYVTDTGLRYAAWFESEEDLQALDSFLEQMAAIRVDQLSSPEQKAFYINLYNAAMLQAVFKAYPIDSVKAIGMLPFSIFKKSFIDQGERVLSLDQIEKSILLVDFFDPRIHFAVNCASESCPPLRAEPFVAAQLEAQLEAQTRLFAMSDRAVRVDDERRINLYSSLFDWYNDDFPGKNPGEYLNIYREEPVNLKYTYEWIPYDWSLNSVNE